MTPWAIVHGILQARILEWVAIPFSRGSSQPTDQTQVSQIAGGFFTSWATREAPFSLNSVRFFEHLYPRDSLIAQLVKNLFAMPKTLVWFLGHSAGEGIGYPCPVFLGFPCGSAGKESTSKAGDLGLIPGLGRSSRKQKGYPLQYSDLENSMD